MRVKRLEIQGFKSFKDKTVIHFDHSITGIVGPNGCGKSNIVDAFFWVMGEQSYKHMRGSGSGDLIFNGSSKYSPVGLAEATLVLETDVADTETAPAGASVQEAPLKLKTKEISVTRRVYRSGEGEYFINGVPARLKDIHELFMDTGVGAKGYSVIEQGQIGKIVNSKPEERRLLIEEAAGIAKYKARKKESIRKMEAARGNLDRLNDVISEIERNLASLERQAQKAKKYREYKEELLDKEMTWGRRKSVVLRQKLEAVRKERTAIEQELTGLRAELQTAENNVEADRIAHLSDSKASEELQNRIQEFSTELTRERSALELSQKRQEDLETQLNTLRDEKQTLESSIAEEKEKVASHEAEVGSAQEVYDTAASEASSVEDSVRSLRGEAEELKRSLDQKKRELMAGITEGSELNSRIARLVSQMESATKQSEKISQQLGALQERLSAGRADAERAEISLQEKRRNKESLLSERDRLREEIRSQDSSHREAKRDHAESEKVLTQLRSRLQSLEELAAAHEGFGDGPKAALEWAAQNGLSRELQAISDSYNVQSGYEPALEAWLESRIEGLFAERAEVAIDALEKLHQEKSGRASVYLSQALSALDEREKSAQPVDFTSMQTGADVSLQTSPRISVQRPGEASWDQVRNILISAGFDVKCRLGDVVKIDGTIGEHGTQAAQALVNRVAVVSSLRPLADFLRVNPLSKLCGWGIAGLDGMALDPNGLLHGGSTESDTAASVLGRKRAMQDLQAQIRSAEEIHSAAETQVQNLEQALAELRTQLEQTQEQLNDAEVAAASQERELQQQNRTVSELSSQIELLELEKTELVEQAELSFAERAETEARQRELISRKEEMESLISGLEQNLGERESALRAREEELNEIRVREASLKERAHSLKREMEAAHSLIRDRERRLADVQRVLERAAVEREQHSGSEGPIQQAIEALAVQLSESRDELSALKDRLEQTSAKINEAHARMKKIHAEVEQKASRANELALELERATGDLTHLTQNLEEKYGPGCLNLPVTSPIQEEMEEPVVTAEMSEEEEKLLGEEVERLREKIRRLGEVNVMAIEEYEEVNKRHEHLITERLDLEQSIENLNEAIDHINKTSEDRFRKAFDAISDRFEKLFPIIFGGGQAKLSLVFPEGSDDILDAGVDILAQPPGKKVVNISLLSGGEKALTAVSLIFAIFMVKPSPFCVLDEVDAPLDDANIGKFNALLREMSAKSQFIIITHNKKTMELNDTLYGVTMEEPGVSKMVSIEMQ